MKKIIAISFLFVFISLQYGKIVSYLYCELRIEISTSKTENCDCETIIADQNDELPGSDQHPNTLKDRLNEPYTTTNHTIVFASILLNTSCFTFRTNNLHNGFLNPPYHPPAIIS